MSNYDFYPVKTQATFNNMYIGQRGLFFNRSTKLLLVGIITKTGLRGRVIHTGVTQDEIDKGYRPVISFGWGYTYDMWDMHEFKYIGRLRNYTSINGYLEYIKNANYNQLKDYFEAERLIKELL